MYIGSSIHQNILVSFLHSFRLLVAKSESRIFLSFFSQSETIISGVDHIRSSIWPKWGIFQKTIYMHIHVSSANFNSNCRLLSEDGEMKIYRQSNSIDSIDCRSYALYCLWPIEEHSEYYILKISVTYNVS